MESTVPCGDPVMFTTWFDTQPFSLKTGLCWSGFSSSRQLLRSPPRHLTFLIKQIPLNQVKCTGETKEHDHQSTVSFLHMTMGCLKQMIIKLGVLVCNFHTQGGQQEPLQEFYDVG